MSVCCVCAVKGGAGKSTAATNLAVSAVKDGYSVVLADADKVLSSYGWQGIRKANDIEAIPLNQKKIYETIRREAKRYDLVIVDVGAGESESLRLAVMASDLVLVPTPPSIFDIWATEDIGTIVTTTRQVVPDLHACLFLNNYDPRQLVTQQAHDALEDLKEKGLFDVLDSSIQRRTAYQPAISLGLSAAEYDPQNWKLTEEMERFYNEVKRKMGGGFQRDKD